MANEYMTIQELRELAEEYDIYIPYRYRKDEIIDLINEYLEENPDLMKKSDKRKSAKKVVSYAPTYNIVNNYYTVPEIKEIAKLNDIELPAKLTKEELILIINSIINDRLKNKTPKQQLQQPKPQQQKPQAKQFTPKSPKKENKSTFETIPVPKLEILPIPKTIPEVIPISKQPTPKLQVLPIPKSPKKEQQQPKQQQQPKPPKQQQQPKPPKLVNKSASLEVPKINNLIPVSSPKKFSPKRASPLPLIPSVPKLEPIKTEIIMPVFPEVSTNTSFYELPVLPSTEKVRPSAKVRSLPRIITPV